jgi:hypothetical protein
MMLKACHLSLAYSVKIYSLNDQPKYKNSEKYLLEVKPVLA